MSLHDYETSKHLSEGDPSFASLIMAALRKADSGNAAKLREQWPEICAEMQARYDAPGGVLPTDERDYIIHATVHYVCQSRKTGQTESGTQRPTISVRALSRAAAIEKAKAERWAAIGTEYWPVISLTLIPELVREL